MEKIAKIFSIILENQKKIFTCLNEIKVLLTNI
jgi:hypothetical protein